MIGSVTKNGGRREMETDDRICQKRKEREWKLMIGSVTKNGGRREMETYEMETYDRVCDQKRREKRNVNL